MADSWIDFREMTSRSPQYQQNLKTLLDFEEIGFGFP
jgi:hypothetical protein